MKRKTMLALMLAVSMTCSMGAATTAMAAEDSATEENAEAADTTEASDADQEAADNVAALIDKIYVQERNDTTDEDCKAAKEAWDALTDAQKELVEGENADPDISDVTQEILPRTIRVTRMRSVRMNFLL